MVETKRARYTLEFKMEAVRLVRGGQVAAVTAKVMGIPKPTLENWVRLGGKGGRCPELSFRFESMVMKIMLPSLVRGLRGEDCLSGFSGRHRLAIF